MNDFVDAIRHNSTTLAFKRRYRECDVLLIDDVQFMERKEGLQEEFFHTFNALYGASKQIVLTSDRPPKSIATLEDRLRSRFLSGPHHRDPAPGARDPPGHPADQGRARARRTSPTTSSSSSPPTSRTTSGSSRARSSGSRAFASLNQRAHLAGTRPRRSCPTSSRPASPGGSPPR